MLQAEMPLSFKEYRFVLRNDLTSFIQAAFYELNPQSPYIPADHVELIADRLEACRRGEIKRLIINLPPRNLKSICVSVAFVAWLLGHSPSTRVICASYGQELSEKLARDTRNVMTSDWYESLFETRISDRRAVRDFDTTEMGVRLAVSVGGPVTGRGAEFIILDDPIKPEDALSESLRKSANGWYDNTLLSRLNDKATGCIIIVMQRLHLDDLIGHVQAQEHWDILSFPAITEVETEHKIESPFGTRMFRRSPGEALHPERESIEMLNGIRNRMGEYNFAGQYQQQPIPTGGAIVKYEWLNYYEPGSRPAKFGSIIQSWDTANKTGELNDYSVCTTWGIHNKLFYLLHVYRQKVDFPTLRRAVLDLKARFRPSRILVEDKASGIQLIQELRNSGIHVTPYCPTSGVDKLMRLHMQTNFFEGGQIYLPKTATWLDEYVREITGFPGTLYADQVDSTTQFLDHIRSRGVPMVITDELLARAAMPGPYTFRYS